MLAVHLENAEGFPLLRLLAGGICNTHLELQRGYYAFDGGRFAAAVPLLAHTLVRVEELIAARFPLAEAPQAFARAA